MEPFPRLEDLTLMDDYMFGTVMQDPKLIHLSSTTTPTAWGATSITLKTAASKGPICPLATRPSRSS